MVKTEKMTTVRDRGLSIAVLQILITMPSESRNTSVDGTFGEGDTCILYVHE